IWMIIARCSETSRCSRAKSAAVGGGGSAVLSLSAATTDIGANATIIAIPKRTHLGKFLACFMSTSSVQQEQRAREDVVRYLRNTTVLPVVKILRLQDDVFVDDGPDAAGRAPG